MIKIFPESDKFSHKAGVTKHATNSLARKSLFNSCLDIKVDTSHKCSHFIGYYNHMMSNFSHLILRVLLLYLNLMVVLFMVHFYGNITMMVLENAVHNGTNVLK